MANIITRKIQIKPVSKDDYEKLHNICYWGSKILNDVYSNMALVFRARNLEYIKGEAMPKIEDLCNNKSPNYTVAKKYKSKVKSYVYNGCSFKARKDFENDIKDVLSGKRSYRSYRKHCSVPFMITGLRLISTISKEYNWLFAGIPIVSYLGSDRNSTRILLNRVYEGEYKLCDSSIKYDSKKKKFFIFLVFKMPESVVKYDEERQAEFNLSIDNLISIDYGGKKDYNIGDMSLFLAKRTELRLARRRLSQQLKFRKGGKGRNKKMKAFDRIGQKEHNFVETFLHGIAKASVDFCEKNRIGTIVLNTDDTIFSEVDEQMKKLIVSNWSAYSLKSKIEYKAKMRGIKIKEAVCAAVS